MAVRVLFDSDQSQGTFFCSTTGSSFGPVLPADFRSDLQEFIDDCDDDLRSLEDEEIWEAWETYQKK